MVAARVLASGSESFCAKPCERGLRVRLREREAAREGGKEGERSAEVTGELIETKPAAAAGSNSK